MIFNSIGRLSLVLTVHYPRLSVQYRRLQTSSSSSPDTSLSLVHLIFQKTEFSQVFCDRIGIKYRVEGQIFFAGNILLAFRRSVSACTCSASRVRNEADRSANDMCFDVLFSNGRQSADRSLCPEKPYTAPASPSHAILF